MQVNIRKISKPRIESFQKLSGKKIDLRQLKHMIVSKTSLDLSKAKNWMERSAAERITIDPMRQGRGENEQLSKLNTAFKNVVKYKPGTIFLYNGKVYDHSNVPNGVRTDLDAVIEEQNHIIL